MRNPHLVELTRNFEQLLSRYARFETTETKDVKRPEKGCLDTVRKEEAKLLLKALPKNAHTVLLDERGKTMSTEDLMAWVERLRATKDHVNFVIGGPDGLHEDIRAKADEKLSLGKLTWTHEMARMLLVEQLYRVTSAEAGHPYHRGGGGD
jgi:23S rRNA (pseudouridine1915-N3)-methyltransferase